MLRFFRHIRQKLLLEGRASKYIGYALGEIVLIVVGIMIALKINDWNQAQIDREAEEIYIEELIEDFHESRLILERTNLTLNNILASMVVLLEQSALPKPTLSAEELREAFRKVQHMPTFTSVDRTYSNLMGSGDLKILKNRELKNALAVYYSKEELVSIVQNTHEMELVQIFEPYFIEHMEYQAFNGVTGFDDYSLPPPAEIDQILESLHTRKFRNIVNQKWKISGDLLKEHREILAMTEDIIGLLNEQAELAN